MTVALCISLSLRGLKGRGNPLQEYLKSAIARCSAGPISFARPKEMGERKRRIGEGYRQSRPPLCTPPPESENLRSLFVCLHGCQLVNTVRINNEYLTIPKFPAP